MIVGDFATLVRGTTYKGALVGAPGPALLGLGSIVPGGGFRADSYKTYGGECPEKLMLVPGDLYVSLKGATKDGEMIGSIARVPPEVPLGRLTQDTVKLKLSRDDYKFSSYIYWLLRNPHYRAYCAGRATGSAVVALSRDDFLSYPVPEFSSARLQLTELLDAIEEKVELNRRMNETLEAMARAIFKDWFVDFGPTRAKSDGRSPYLAPDIWALFPDRLDDHGKPIDWRISAIGDEVDVVGGSTPSTKEPAFWGGAHAWATPKDLSNLSVPVLLSTERSITDAGLSQIGSGLLPEGAVLLSSRAPIGYLAISKMPTAINQGFIAMICDGAVSNVHAWLWAQANIDLILQHANGSTFQEISKKNFRPLPITVANSDTLSAFDKTVRPLFDRIVANERESRTLDATRDILLPKLMSGEISIFPAEAMVAAAA
jgi:type I restriction enzyme S subunit